MDKHADDDRLAAGDNDDAGSSVLTVEEAARVLRIGRGAAYAAARRWRATHGREGLPVIVLGRSLRVPSALLKQMLDNPGSVVVEAKRAGYDGGQQAPYGSSRYSEPLAGVGGAGFLGGRTRETTVAATSGSRGRR